MLLAPLSVVRAADGERTRPNIVIFIADDLCWYDVACFGGPTSARTPNLDRLAAEGMKLTGFFGSATVCAPTRQALLTGLYPVRNGAFPNHSDVKPETRSLPHHFKTLGYRTACIGKVHFGPAECFPFDLLEIARGAKAARKEMPARRGADTDADDGDIDLQAFERFASRGDGPFCAYLATHEPHAPFTKGDSSAHDPKSFVLAPYLADTKATRARLQAYYAEIDVMDRQVGKVMRILERTGTAGNTLMLFLSEQGAGWPLSKWTLYNAGVRVAAIARWPGRIKPGSTSAALMQYEDVLPTILAAAGAQTTRVNTGCPDATGDTGFDGRDALDVLLGKIDRHRDCVFGQNTMLGVNGVTSPYASRMVCDGHWKLIVNYHSPANFPHADFGLGLDWKSAGSAGDHFAASQYARLMKRPATELYDLRNDPWELTNVADQPGNEEAAARLRARLDAWLGQQGDDPVKTESAAHDRQPGRRRKGGRPT